MTSEPTTTANAEEAAAEVIEEKTSAVVAATEDPQQEDQNDKTNAPKTTPKQQDEKEKQQQDEEKNKDEEGLLLQYDVILCGTGLVQSILASALTRAGKTVLHCDGNDYYGELDTVWTFDYLNEMFERQKNKNNNNNSNSNSDKQDDDNNNDQKEEEEDETTTKIIKLIPLASKGSNQNLQFHSIGRCNRFNFPITEIGTKVKTSYGEGTVTGKTLPTTTTDENGGRLEITLSNWSLADGKSPIVYYGVPQSIFSQQSQSDNKEEDIMEDYFQNSSKKEVQSLRYLQATDTLQNYSRSLALDVSPCLLYANGIGVQGLLTSGVAEHLEFQTMQGMYWFEFDTTTEGGISKLERVPCNKGDVMQSSLLPPLDKRRFMKFFQSAMDYATERELNKELLEEREQQQQKANDAADSNNDIEKKQQEEDRDPTTATTEEGVLSLNERQLNQGRSLARPQNKAMAKKDLQVLYDCMEQNMDFDTYLNTQAKLSPRLRNLIRYALALEIGDGNSSSSAGGGSGISTREGMERLCDHLKALGRFGTTAFLTPLYGSGELSQFFCRSAAVYGATYLLRRVPKHVTINASTNKVDGVTMGATTTSDFGFGPSVPQKHIRANHVILAQDSCSTTISATAKQRRRRRRRRLLRRISVLRGSTLIPGGGGGGGGDTRSVLIIPPSSKHPHPIHGLLLDETTRIAPRGCSVLHLTTVIDQEEEKEEDGKCESSNVLEQALSVLLQQQQQSTSEVVDEVFHTTFSYGLEEEEGTETNDDTNSTPNGLHWVKRSAMPLVVDEAFEQAKTIFTSICGTDLEFLALSDAMQTKLKEQLKDAYRGPGQVEDDTEQVALDSAMEMLDQETTTSQQQQQQSSSSSSSS